MSHGPPELGSSGIKARIMPLFDSNIAVYHTEIRFLGVGSGLRGRVCFEIPVTGVGENVP
jgi:hypothetical protein